MNEMNAILIEGMAKSYGRQEALRGLTLTVERGEIFGFLGPNGAGTSTTIRLLLDLIRPSAGHASVLGHDCRRESHLVRARTGYLAGDLRLYPGLTGRQTAEFVAAVRGIPADDAHLGSLARTLDLDLDRRVSTYSKGNRQKLGLLLALLGRPPLLLLDEPTSGLDPIMQHAVWQLLTAEATRGATVFFSSHVMSEVEQICQRVAILRAGRLVAVEPVAQLKGRALRHVEVSFAGEPPPPAAFALPGVREIRRAPPTLEFEVTGEIDALLKAIAPHHVLDLRTEQPTLDEVLLGYYRESAA
ncbi:MAG: ABC transporter ATP-binding protein [Dehalococcoidia bacterium]|nr:ABC transporter ATP-binding protein [Dehalococcoidia bacterium]